MGVAGGHQGETEPSGDFDRPLQRQSLDFQAVVLYLDEIAISEHLLEPAGGLQGLVQVELAVGAAQERTAQLPGDASAKADQPFAMRRQKLLVDPRLAVETLEEGGGGQLDEVLEA